MAGKKKVKRKSAKKMNYGLLGPFNLAVISVAAAFTGQYFWFIKKQLEAGLVFFVAAGIIFILAGAVYRIKQPEALSDHNDLSNAGKEKKNAVPLKWEALLFVLIMAAAVFFRVYMITEVPSGCYRDEGQNANEAINIMEGRVIEGTALPVYIERFTQNAAMYMYFIAAMFKMFGIDVLQIRLVSVILGTASVGAMYFLLRYLFGVNLALAGMFLLAVMRWHVNFSRMGFLGIFTVLLFIVVIYFAYRAYKERKWTDFAMLGITVGWSLYSYIAARLIPAALGLFVLYLLIRKRDFIFKNWKKMVLSAAMLAVVLIPLGSYVAKHSDAFMTRTSTVSIFNEGMLKAIGGPYVDREGNVKHWTELYAKNFKEAMLMFNYMGDGNPRHNYNRKPMLDFTTGMFFALGFLYMLSRFFNPYYFLYFSFFFVMLQAGLLSIESPQAYRTIALIPLTIIAVVVALDRIRKYARLQYGDRLNPVLLGLLVAGLVYAGYENYRDYFHGWAKDPGAWAEFSTDEYNMAKYLKELGPDWVGIVNPAWVDSYTFRFATKPYENYVKFELSEWIPIRSKIYKNYVYILDTNYLPLVPVLEKMYPGGKYTDFRHKFLGRILYFTYEVPYSEVKKYQNKPVVNGLHAEYFRDEHTKDLKSVENHWKGDPRFERVDSFVLFNWTVPPILGPFSVEWTGKIKAEQAGKYIFMTKSNDYSDLYINNKKILENPGGGGLRSERGEIFLEKGMHNIKLRYYESTNYSKMQFWWQPPGSLEMQVVPSEVLFP
ncbi:MAG: glycosyltransferase family 39 protein [Candidatus Goldiibacteriota bacterium]